MHDHGSPGIRFDSATTPEELRTTIFTPMMAETKQLHSMYSITHYHPHIAHPHQSFHQFPLQAQHQHQNDSLLYGYMVSQQQEHVHSMEHQNYAHQQNSEQRNLMIPSQTHHHEQPQQQLSQQHQQTKPNNNIQQQISNQHKEQYSSLTFLSSHLHAEQQIDDRRLGHQKYLFCNTTSKTQYDFTGCHNKYSDSQTKSNPGAIIEENAFSEKEPKSFQDLDEVDEDLIDDEEEEDLRLCYEKCKQSLLLKHPNVATELLKFAENASLDIQRFFGRTKGEEDACDVYEDKWAATKSGRELYYADLIRIAQGGDTEPVNSKKGKKGGSLGTLRTSPSITPYSSVGSLASSSVSPPEADALDTRARYSGKRDVSIGMGALSDLFEVGLSDQPGRDSFTSSSRTRHATAQRSKYCTNRLAPKMRERSFPNSFWKEPSNRISAGYVSVTAMSNLDYSHIAPMSNSKLPDFSDLMDSWHGSAEALVSSGQDGDQAMSASLPHHH